MDNLKGLLMLLVVCTHFLLPYVREGVTSREVLAATLFVYCFHMPLFVVVSGFFSKDAGRARDTAFAKLLVPYLLFDGLMAAFGTLRSGEAPPLLEPLYVNWYLLALFVWRYTLADLLRYRFVLPASVVLGLFVGFAPEIDNTLALSRIVAFLPFFLIGYYTGPQHIEAIRSISKGYAVLGLVVTGAGVYVLAGRLSLFALMMMPYPDPTGAYVRLMVYLIAAIVSVCVVNLVPAGTVPLLTESGRYSFLVYVLHRYATFALHELLPVHRWSDRYLPLVLALSLATLYALGRPSLHAAYERGMRALLSAITHDPARPPLSSRGSRAVIGALVVVNLTLTTGVWATLTRVPDPPPRHPVISPAQREALAESVDIAFIGDMILLEDQVRRAYRGDHYDFAPVFEHARETISAADYTIGVLELPLAGEAAGYSESNYGDGLPLHLNAPDAWGEAIRDAGVDLVSTANNHALDKGLDGLHRTLDALDAMGLDHVGTRRSPDEPEVFTAEVGGVRIAVVACTFTVNGFDNGFFSGDHEHLVAVLDPQGSRGLAASRARIARAVARAKALDPDVVIALPHMGAQFSHDSDAFGRAWVDFMLAQGVDVVLADHSHAVQPIEIRPRPEPLGPALVLYSPGNFVNSYLERDGDAGAMVSVHLSTRPADRGRLVAASVAPLWIRCAVDGPCQPVPVATAVRDPDLRARLSLAELRRLEEVQRLVTRVMLGVELGLDQLQDGYFLFPQTGYARQPIRSTLSSPLPPQDPERRALYDTLAASKEVLVIGDSVSEGTVNGGYGWIEPICALLPDTECADASRGGDTTGKILARLDAVPVEGADTIVLAVGVNDVRYRDETCAPTPEAYVENMATIVQRIRERNPRATFAFVAPWPAYRQDIHSELDDDARDAMIAAYGAALGAFAREHGHLFVDATPILEAYLERHVVRDAILDHVHPDAREGIELYSNAVLFGDPEQWAIEVW